MKRRYLLLALAGLWACSPVEGMMPPTGSIGLTPPGAATPATTPLPSATATASTTPAPTPTPSSVYNGVFKLGRTWVYKQTVQQGTSSKNSKVRVIVVGLTLADATIAIQEEPFPQFTPGATARLEDTPGKRSKFALDWANPFEKWGGAEGATPATPKATATERITVPAGVFDTTRFTYEAVMLDYQVKRELWIDRVAGLVKLVTTYAPAGAGATASGGTTWELESSP